MTSHNYIAEFDLDDAAFEVEIEYDMHDGGWEFMVPGEPGTRCWIPGRIELVWAAVLSVIYYDDQGEAKPVIRRDDLDETTRNELDLKAAEYVDREIESGGSLLDELFEAALETEYE